MRPRGVLMFATVLATSGCFQSAALPPSSSIPRQSTPGLPPRSHTAPEPIQSKTGLWNTPWMPSAEPRSWKYLVLHHTASEGGSVNSIHEAHLQRKDNQGRPWKGIGYHFVIGNGNGMADGAVEPTFRWREQMHGAHAGVADYNNLGIGIVLIGNFQTQPPSTAQLASLERLVTALSQEYGITTENVIGHNDVKATACPGRHFPLASIKQQIAFSSDEQRSHEDSRIRLAGLKEHQEQ